MQLLTEALRVEREKNLNKIGRIDSPEEEALFLTRFRNIEN